jgi:hypothetical protein
VLGIDIFPPTLPHQPENLDLSGYNLNDRLNDAGLFERNAYDLVHSRFVGQGIKNSRWSSYVQDIRRLLKPGGWLQMMEYYPNIQSDSGLLPNQSALTQWWNTYVEAMKESNRSPRIGQRLQHLMNEAGLREVYGSSINLPIGAWPSGTLPVFFFASVISTSLQGESWEVSNNFPDPRLASIGRDMVGMVGVLLDSLAIWPFTERLGMTDQEVKDITNNARRELDDPTLRLYLPM